MRRSWAETSARCPSWCRLALFHIARVRACLPAAPRLLVFGGQAAHVCQLNDVAELDLATLTWRQLSAPRFCTHRCRKAHRQGLLG